MRVFKNESFAKFARRENISDGDLCEAIARADRGLIDADLGGGVIKQRIARPNQGRSGGFRSIVFFRSGERAFFVFGFAKNVTENISPDNVKAFKLVAKVVLNHDDKQLQKLLDLKQFVEVDCVQNTI